MQAAFCCNLRADSADGAPPGTRSDRSFATPPDSSCRAFSGNSVKIVLDFTGVSRLSGNNSVIPFLTAAEKRRFCPPETARTAGRSGRPDAEKRQAFLLLSRRGVQNPSILTIFSDFPHLPQAAFPAAISSCSDVFCQRSRTAAQRPVFGLPAGTPLDCVLKAAQTADTGATGVTGVLAVRSTCVFNEISIFLPRGILI